MWWATSAPACAEEYSHEWYEQLESLHVTRPERETSVVSTFALIFVVLWLLGSISSLTAGGFIHVFLAMAIGMMLPRIIRGRKVAEY